MTIFYVARQFTDEPGGRFYTDGDGSGQEFREKHLVGLIQQALASGEGVTINFDGVLGLPTSFSEEAFGGLIRTNPQWRPQDVLRLLTIEAPNSPRLWAYVTFAQRALKRAAENATK